MTNIEPLSESTLRLRHELIEAGSRFYQNGWLFGTSGNLSGRIKDRIVITASGCDKGSLTENDFVETSLDGVLLAAAREAKPSAEASIHTAIYQSLPDVRAILHVHTPASTKLRAQGPYPSELVFKDLEMLKGWGLWSEGATGCLPIFENHSHVPDISEDTRRYYSTERDVPAFVIEGHGITAWGKDVASARRHVEVTEFFCRLQET